jgi:hypothetical protein
MPQFEENDPSSEISSLAYCGTAPPRRLGVPHPKAAVRTRSHRHRQRPLTPRSLGTPPVSEIPSFIFSPLSTENLTDWVRRQKDAESRKWKFENRNTKMQNDGVAFRLLFPSFEFRVSNLDFRVWVLAPES